MRTIRIVAVTRDAELREWLSSLPPEGKLQIQAFCTGSVPQAVALAQDEETRLVLLDDTAAAGEGFLRATRKVRIAQREISVLSVISRPDPRLEVQLRQMGVLFIAVRPIDHALLKKVLHQALHTDTRKHYKRGTPPVGVPVLSAGLEK